MTDISTTFGFVFSVEDQTSPALERAQAAAETAGDRIEGFLGGVVDSAASIIGGLGPAAADIEEELGSISQAAEGLTNSMADSFDELANDPVYMSAMELLEQLQNGMDQAQVEAGEMADAFNDLAGAYNNLGDALISQGGLDAILDDFSAAAEAFVEDLDEMEDSLELLIEMVGVEDQPASFVGSLALALGQVGLLGAALNSLGGRLQAGGGGFGRFGGAILKGFGNLFGGGGVMGYLLGPIGPILEMLSPLISLLADTLMPIFQDFLGIIQNAFAPLQFVLDTLLQSLIPDIQEMLAPLVDMLTYVAVDLGTQLQQMFGGLIGLIGPTMSAIVGLMPVLQDIFASIIKVTVKALPLFLRLLSEVVPVVVELAKILAEAFITRMDIIAEMIEELGPDLIDLVVELLKLALPLTKAFVDLGNVLLSQVFTPLLIPLIKATVEQLTRFTEGVADLAEPIVIGVTAVADTLRTFREDWNRFMQAFPEVAGVLDWVKEQFLALITFLTDTLFGFMTGKFLFDMIGGVKDVLVGFGGWLGDFVPDLLRALWEDIGVPLASLMSDLWDVLASNLADFGEWAYTKWQVAYNWLIGLGTALLDALGLGDVVDQARGLIQTALAALQVPLESLKQWINYYIIDTINEVLAAQIPVVGLSLGDLTSKLYGYSSLPQLADGGVATGEQGVTAEIGEAGTAEAIVPLDREHVDRFMEPIVSQMEFPGLEEQTDLLSDLVELGKAVVRLLERAEDREERAGESARDDYDVESDLRGGISLGGFTPVGG